MIRSPKGLVASIFVLVATLVPAAPVTAAGAPHFIWPTTGRITQPYGCTGFRMEPKYGTCPHFHGGIDIADKRGTPIRAAGEGVIQRVGWDQWGTHNWMVIINHGDGYVTWYAHLRGKRLDGIKKGARVRQGQLIGYMDSTGYATGPHLHWAVLKNGRYSDPTNYVGGQPRRSGSATGSDPATDDPATGGTAAVCEDQFAVPTDATEPVAFVMESNDGGGGGPPTCVA
ncbi:MAG: M23 family metallopeptidase [Candidatus Limnocylindrales bacterium]